MLYGRVAQLACRQASLTLTNKMFLREFQDVTTNDVDVYSEMYSFNAYREKYVASTNATHHNIYSLSCAHP